MRQIEFRLQQHFSNVPDHLQAIAFNHAPKHIVGREFGERRGKTTKRQEPFALERQRSPDVRVAAHEVEVEIRLERRLGRLTIAQTAFVAVQACQ
ncbi:hypothetical protein D3C78_1421670 [compost metagenome]